MPLIKDTKKIINSNVEITKGYHQGVIIWQFEEPIPPFDIKLVSNWASGEWYNGTWYPKDSYNEFMSTKNKVRFASASQIKFGLNASSIDTYNIPAVEVVIICFYDANQNYISKVVNVYNNWANIPNNANYYTFTARMNSGRQNLQTQLTKLNPTVEFR